MGMTVDLPCKIGDDLCGIRCFRGFYRPRYGVVSEMFFKQDMSLCIVLGHICRGEFGKDVFLTREECEKECERRNNRWK